MKTNDPQTETRQVGPLSPLDRVVAVLLAYGWQADGATEVERVRTPAGAGDQGRFGPAFVPRDLGGRRRFRHGDDFRTIGPRTTCFYRKREGRISEMVNHPTRDAATIEEEAAWRGVNCSEK